MVISYYCPANQTVAKLKHINELIISSSLNSHVDAIKSVVKNDAIYISCDKDNFFETLCLVHQDNNINCTQLIDIIGVDYPHKTERFQVIYSLLSLEHNIRVFITVNIKQGDSLPSITSIIPNANWLEREVWDMFGITFDNHPNMRRILTDYGFTGHPLRKDFPLSGHVETYYDEDDKAVKYRPVDLEQEYRDFKANYTWEHSYYDKIINSKQNHNNNKD